MPQNTLPYSASTAPAEVRSGWALRGLQAVRERVMDVNPDEVTFGVEIEGALHEEECPERGPHWSGYQVPWLPRGWKAESDGSLRGFDYDYTAVEFTSPVLKGRAGLDEVLDVMDELNQRGFLVNSSCGVHVHIGAKSVLGEDFTPKEMGSWLYRLAALMSREELALLVIGGSTARFNNRYCRSVKPLFGNVKAWQGIDKINQAYYGTSTPAELTSSTFNEMRYRTLNLNNLRNHRKTVEFRIFAGTTNRWKVAGYILMAIGMAVRAAKVGRAVHYERDELAPAPNKYVSLVERLQRDVRPFLSKALRKNWRRIVKNQNWNARRMAGLLNAPEEGQE